MTRIARARSALDDLNEAQLRAVTHDGGPLLVIAGAGSGKTKTLACRVARLVRDGADPARILMLTFSRRAADEMAKRVAAVATQEMGLTTDVQLPWSGTFHAIGARLLREYAPVIGLNAEFTVHDRSDSADLMGLVRHERGLSQTKDRFPMKGTCLAIYSRVMNGQEDLGDVLARAFPWCRQWRGELEDLFAAYVEAKQSQSVLDFDDLLYYWAGMMEDPGLAGEVGSKFDHVLVDEYQDTNKLQANILLALRPNGAGVTVVGDDAQAIYGFRAASVDNILCFPKAFTPEATIITLEQNYRSTAPILAASNAVISLAEHRYAKDLYTERSGGQAPKLVTVRDEGEQARYIATEILEARERGMDLKSQAVLFRASDHSAQVELEFTRRDIPFVKFGGLRFLEAAHVKDLIALLRWVQNPADRMAGLRVLLLVPGIGPVRAGRVLDDVNIHGLVGAIREAVPPAGGEEAWEGLAAFIERAGRRDTWPSDLDAAAHWYVPILEARYDDHFARRADIEQLQTIGAASLSRETFLTDLTLDPPNATSDEAGAPHRDDDFVILSTIHSAKGQEWRNVFVINAVDGCILQTWGPVRALTSRRSAVFSMWR